MKKNNDNTMEKIKNVLDNLQDFQYRWFVSEFYLDHGIETFRKEFRELKPELNIINGRNPSEKESRIIELWGKFQILTQLFQTKKFMESEADIVVIGELLVEMAKECMDIGGLK